MFDYKLLAALAAVVEQAGFERAAQALGLSQSAISQRIKLLEARVGQPVLLRDTPPRPTELGQRLLNELAAQKVWRDAQEASIATIQQSARTFAEQALAQAKRLHDKKRPTPEHSAGKASKTSANTASAP